MLETPQVCTLYVARPGPTPDNVVESNAEKPDTSRWSSADTIALSEEGVASARNIAEKFKDVLFYTAFCSYAQRTFQTAQIILEGKRVAIQPKKKFYEMRIGPTEGKTPEEIINFFCEETRYPESSTRKKFPKLWAKRQGKPIQANDVFLDPWRNDMDTFDAFSREFIFKLKKLVSQYPGKTLLVVPHGTPMKAIFAQAQGITTDRVMCAKGAYFAVTIDANGTFVLKKDMMHGISIEPLSALEPLATSVKGVSSVTKSYFASRVLRFKCFKAILGAALFVWLVKRRLEKPSEKNL